MRRKYRRSLDVLDDRTLAGRTAAAGEVYCRTHYAKSISIGRLVALYQSLGVQ
jgi:hypothetical protein